MSNKYRHRHFHNVEEISFIAIKVLEIVHDVAWKSLFESSNNVQKKFYRIISSLELLTADLFELMSVNTTVTSFKQIYQLIPYKSVDIC